MNTQTEKEQVDIFTEGTKKQSLFEKFLKLFSGINNLLPKLKTTEEIITEKITIRKSTEQLEIEKAALELLNNDELLSFQELINNGYQMPLKQEALLTIKIISLFDKDITRGMLDSFLKNGLILTEESMKSIFFHSSFQIYCNDYLCYRQQLNILPQEVFMKKYAKNFQYNNEIYEQHRNYREILKKSNLAKESFGEAAIQIGSYLDNPANNLQMLNSWIKNCEEYIKNQSACSFKYAILEPMVYFKKYITPYLSVNEITKVRRTIINLRKTKIDSFSERDDYKIMNEFMENLDPLFNEINTEKMKELIEKTRIVYLDNKINILTIQKQQEVIKNINTNQLPSEIKLLIKSLQHIYKLLNADKKLIELNTMMDIERLMLKTVPELLQKYLSFDSEYRDTFKNDKQETAKDIMQKSLMNIQDYFENINNDLYQQKLSEFNVQQRYTKTFVK